MRFRLDNALPVGASHHQKIIVVDDALAFSGGLDLTIRRWDTCAARDRQSAAAAIRPGKPYRPFHDVQMVVDGAAARALAEIARERWARVTGERIPCRRSELRRRGRRRRRRTSPMCEIAIARTLPEYGDQQEVREVEALFCDMIARAERAIYIENQFLTCSADRARRWRSACSEKPELEAVIVAPRTHDSWLESHTMRNGRIRFLRTCSEAGVGDRVRLVCPEVRDGERVTDTMVHSKVMIVDDRLLRVGSANLNNRSMGTDTECDLALEARSDAERAAIRQVRARLLADHCGVAAGSGRAGARRDGSLIRAAETLIGRGHRLRADRRRRAGRRRARRIHRGHRRSRAADRRAARLVAALFGERFPAAALTRCGSSSPRSRSLLIALAIAWQFPPLSDIASLEQIGPMLQRARRTSRGRRCWSSASMSSAG